MTLDYFAVVLFFIVLFCQLRQWQRKRALRRQGIYPQPGQASISDVERLLKAGYRIEALMCYREVFPSAGLAEAKAAVDALKH